MNRILEPKIGHWINTDHYYDGYYEDLPYFKCSRCHQDSLEEGLYCPHCGAYMEEEEGWIPVSEKLPEDGTWNRWKSKDGVISVERYKADACDHFYPYGRVFQFEDAIAWMPLSQEYTENQED